MLSLANQLVVRATRFLLGPPEEPALWTISAAGRIVGSLVCEAGGWRLSWFPGADRRLVAYGGPVDGDIEALADLLSARLGAPVQLESLPI
jgi:hypothetical protein